MQKSLITGLIIAWGIFCQSLLAKELTSAKPEAITFDNITVTFLKDTVYQNGNAFSFNTITLSNSSPASQDFTIEAELPANWQQVFDNRKVFNLKPNESLTLPIRVAATPTSGSSSYPININIQSNGVRTSKTFYAKVNQNSNWKAALSNADLKLLRDNRETIFRIELSNRGNLAEELTINFNTNLELTLPKKNNKVVLQPNKDTVINVGIITELRYLEEFKPQEIGISISNKIGALQLLSQRVYSWGTVFKENPSQWYNIPLSIEMISQNVTNSRKSVYLTGAGSISLENQRSLSFNYRSDNFYAASSGESRYANINYSTPSLKVSLGDQTEFSNFLLDGLGARVNYSGPGRYSFNALGIKSRLGDARQFSLAQSLNLGSFVINNRSYVNLDLETKTNNYTNVIEYDQYRGNSHFALEGGMSNEQSTFTGTNLSTWGHTAGFKYDYSSNRLMVRSYSSINSKAFPGINRGLAISTNEVRFKQKTTFIGGLYEYNKRTITRPDSNRYNSLFGGLTQEYGIRVGYNKGSRYISLKASVVNQQQDSITSVVFESQRLNLNTSVTLFKNLNLNFDANIARSRPKDDASVKPFMSGNAFGTVQFKGLGAFVRYEQGPIYYYDLRSYLSDGLKIRRVQLTPFIEGSFFHSAVNARVQLDYGTDMASKTSTSVLRGDLNFNLDKQALSFRIFGSYDLKPAAFSNQNILNVSMRKNLGVPLVGLQKFRNVKVVLYKDVNRNSVFDTGDEPIPDGNLQIGNQFLITNKKGEVYYKNIPDGTYTIDMSQINNVKGWVAQRGYKQSIEVHNNQTIYMPFKQSKYLSGHLNVVRDEYSKGSFNPGNIRITAVNSAGETFYTLTNQKGEFFLNLPADTYVVQINTNVFSESFRVLQESFNADLLNKDEEAIVYEIRESKRQINIQRQPAAK